MADYVLCPRCELNYIQEDEQYCPVCKREMKGEAHDDPFELCSICNENPVMPGKDVCYLCYKEMSQQQGLRSDVIEEPEAPDVSSLDMEDVVYVDKVTPHQVVSSLILEKKVLTFSISLESNGTSSI